jgi:hypothetical protein
VLYNIESGGTTNLFTSRNFQDILLANAIRPSNVSAIPNWNGTNYDFYFASEEERYAGAKSFLLKGDRATRTLKMVDKDFPFHWLGRLDASGRFYLYPGDKGKPGQGGNGALYVRDLQDSSVRTLLSSNNSGQYAIGQFFDGGVIYAHSRHIYRIGLNGSNNVPLFGKRN